MTKCKCKYKCKCSEEWNGQGAETEAVGESRAGVGGCGESSAGVGGCGVSCAGVGGCRGVQRWCRRL